MAVSRNDVLRVAGLARLRLTEAEVAAYTAQLNGILEHMDELSRLEDGAAGPLPVEMDRAARLRSEAERADALAIPPSELAPEWIEVFFTVPRLPALDEAALDDPFEDKARAEDVRQP